MAAKRTPLGHKGRGEAKASLLPVGRTDRTRGDDERRRVHERLARRDNPGELDGDNTARNGKRRFAGGNADIVQLNAPLSKQISWGKWAPGGIR